jgi:hypothetical protein
MGTQTPHVYRPLAPEGTSGAISTGAHHDSGTSFGGESARIASSRGAAAFTTCLPDT